MRTMTELANHCSKVPGPKKNVKALGISPEECQSKDREIVFSSGTWGEMSENWIK